MFLLLINQLVLGNTNLTYNNNNFTVPPPEVGNTDCEKESTAYSEKYVKKESWLPDADMPIKTLYINFNIWQKSDGTGNFVDNPATHARLKKIAKWINDKYEHVNPIAIPGVSYNVTTFNDSKIRVVVDNIYFYKDPSSNNTYYNGYQFHNSVLDEYLDENFPERTKALNIHITNCDLGGAAGYSNNGSIESGFRFTPNAATNTIHDYSYSEHWAHEIGHGFDLWHTYERSAWSQQNCNPSYVDFLTDIYDITIPPAYSSCQVGLIDKWTHPDDYDQDNNLMGDKNQGHISALQMGIIHRSTVLENAYDTGYKMRNNLTGYGSTPFEITQNEVWDFSIKFYQDIVVKSGNTLTIKCEVQMVPQAKIIVEPGAKLIIDGGIITNPEGKDSEYYWKGIEVWGNDNLSQFPFSNQGFIEVKNGGTISNADIAIRTMKVNPDGSLDWNSNGGIVRISDAKFINNNNAIWIGSYHSSIRTFNLSYIKNTEFELNNSMLDGHTGYSFIGLYDVDRISITGNSFTNKQTGLEIDERARGIVAYNVALTVSSICNDGAQSNPATPCIDIDKNSFDGLYYGIYASNRNDYSSSAIKIDQASFVNTYHAMHLINLKNATVTRSDFEIPECSEFTLTPSYGLFLNGCDGFKVEENEFIGSNTKSRGIVIDNSGGNDNEIYNNKFSKLYAAIQAQGDNRGNSFYGLKLICNIMSNDENDIVTVSEDNSVIKGISKYQGILQAGDFIASGDKFSDCEGNSDMNFHNEGYSLRLYIDEAYRPNCVTFNANDHTHDVNITEFPYDDDVCPSKISTGGIGINISDLQTNYITAKLALNSSKVVLNIWKNGGNANLEEEVETTLPWDAFLEFNHLISKSPYLSEDVIMRTIENPAFNSLMIKLIMIANPHANRNKEIMNAIYKRIPEIPKAYINAINAGSNASTQLEMLSANVSSNSLLVNTIGNNIKRVYRNDYENEESISNLISFVINENTLESQYELASLYLETNQFKNMNNVFENIEANYTLDKYQMEDLEIWHDYFKIAQAVKEKGGQLNILSKEQITSLENIKDINRPLISSAAISLLLSNDNKYDYKEVVLPITKTSARMAQPFIETSSIEDDNTLNVYPNPSRDYLTLDYKTKTEYSKLWFEISDSRGSIIMKQTLKGGDNQELINISSLNANIYTLILYGDGERIAVEKITVIN